jgi:hypothetical protein
MHDVQGEIQERSSRVAELWQNLKYGARLLRLNPGFAAVMILHSCASAWMVFDH